MSIFFNCHYDHIILPTNEIKHIVKIVMANLYSETYRYQSSKPCLVTERLGLKIEYIL